MKNWTSLLYFCLSRRRTLRSRQSTYLNCCFGWFLLLPHTCRPWPSESSPTVCASARRSSAKSSPLWCPPLPCPLVHHLPQLPLPLETKMRKGWEQTIKLLRHVQWIHTPCQFTYMTDFLYKLHLYYIVLIDIIWYWLILHWYYKYNLYHCKSILYAV